MYCMLQILSWVAEDGQESRGCVSALCNRLTWSVLALALRDAVCCADSCLEGICYAAPACPEAAVPSICGLLSVIPSMCTQTCALMELQQQLPLKAVGACMQLPTGVTGVQKTGASEYCKHAYMKHCFAA